MLTQDILTGVFNDFNNRIPPNNEIVARFDTVLDQLRKNPDWDQTKHPLRQPENFFAIGYEAALRAHGIITIPADASANAGNPIVKES